MYTRLLATVRHILPKILQIPGDHCCGASALWVAMSTTSKPDAIVWSDQSLRLHCLVLLNVTTSTAPPQTLTLYLPLNLPDIPILFLLYALQLRRSSGFNWVTAIRRNGPSSCPRFGHSLAIALEHPKIRVWALFCRRPVGWRLTRTYFAPKHATITIFSNSGHGPWHTTLILTLASLASVEYESLAMTSPVIMIGSCRNER